MGYRLCVCGRRRAHGRDVRLQEQARCRRNHRRGLSHGVWRRHRARSATFYFRGVFLDLNRSILVADTLSVALFALAGSSKAFAYGLDPVYVVILGTITAVGGGALRDAMAGVTPAIFRGSNFYAVACLGGSVTFAAMAYFGLPLVEAGFGCVGAVLALRYLSIRFDWKTREYCDLTPRVVAAAKGASSSSHQPDRLEALPNGRED